MSTTADYDALFALGDRFNDLAAAFRNAARPLGLHYDSAITGAGRFTPDLEGGAVRFLLTWKEAFGVCEKSAGLISGNIGKTVVDLRAVDVDQSEDIRL
jgi:hypothetical protein